MKWKGKKHEKTNKVYEKKYDNKNKITNGGNIRTFYMVNITHNL